MRKCAVDPVASLSRVVRQEDGSYTATTDDQIVNNLVEESGYNSSELVATQTYEKIVQIVLCCFPVIAMI